MYYPDAVPVRFGHAVDFFLRAVYGYAALIGSVDTA